MKKKSPSPKLCAMSGGRGRRGTAAAAPGKDAPAKEAPSPGRKRIRSNEAETAAEDVAKEVADIEESTDPQAPKHLPAGLLERRLSMSNDTIKKLEKDKAEMQKKMAELLEAHKKRNEEEAKAGKLAKLVEGASPGAVVQVGRQVHSYLLPCFRVNNVIFCSQKSQARVKTGSAARVQDQASIPTTSLLDAYGGDSSYTRIIQNLIVPQTVSVQGFRWHHAVKRSVMHAVVRDRTIAMGGKFVHWDALDARSPDSGKSEKLVVRLGNSHFHAHQQHRDIVRRCVAALFEASTECEINAVKFIVFGVDQGLPILRDPGVITGAMVGLDTDHPVITALSKVPLPSCYTQRVLFETPKSPATVSTVLHNRTTPDQQKLAALLG